MLDSPTKRFRSAGGEGGAGAWPCLDPIFLNIHSSSPFFVSYKLTHLSFPPSLLPSLPPSFPSVGLPHTVVLLERDGSSSSSKGEIEIPCPYRHKPGILTRIVSDFAGYSSPLLSLPPSLPPSLLTYLPPSLPPSLHTQLRCCPLRRRIRRRPCPPLPQPLPPFPLPAYHSLRHGGGSSSRPGALAHVPPAGGERHAGCISSPSPLPPPLLR